MTPRFTDPKKRRDIVLAVTINQYIDTVTPVSSRWISKNYDLEVSPATIRNILAELESDGYLTHPHTSAGRVPTQRGYRYYVDNLMKEIQLLKEEKERIKAEYEKDSFELEVLLEKTTRVLSEVTHYTTIVSVDGWKNKMFCRGTNFVVGYPDQNDINKIKNILSALEEKEHLLELLNRDIQKKLNIYIGYEIAYSKINNCSLVISRYKAEGHSGSIAVLGPTRMNYEKVVSTLDYFSELMEEML